MDVIDAMQDSLIVTSPEGNVVYLNHAGEHLLNLTFTQAFGRHLYEIISLLPVGPRPGPVTRPPSAVRGFSFDPGRLQGYWLLRLGNSLPLVNVSVSAMEADPQGHRNLLFTIRQLQEEGGELEPVLPPHPHYIQVNHEAFHKHIHHALRASQRWNLEHSLLCIQFDMAELEPGEYELLVSTLLRYVPRTDASCMLGIRKYAVLLEGYSLAHSIRRSFELIRALSSALSTERARRRDLTIRVGIAPVNRFGPSNTTNLIGMAMQACYEARQTGKSVAVRVYRPDREPPVSTLTSPIPGKGHST